MLVGIATSPIRVYISMVQWLSHASDGVHSGSLMATGSADASMKVLGVGKVSQFACGSAAGIGTRALSQFEARAMQMLNFAQTGRSSDEFAGTHWNVRHCERAALDSLTRCLTCYWAAAKPVLRTLYNHTQVGRTARCLASSVMSVRGYSCSTDDFGTDHCELSARERP